MSAQREISLADPPTRRPAPGHRSLSAEQRLALLQVYQRVPGAAPPREFLQRLVTQISDIIRVKAAVAGKHEGAWVLAAESQVEPVLTIPVNGGAEGLEQFGADPARGVELWSSGGIEWTLVSLASTPRSPVLLILEGNWIDASAELIELAKSLLSGHQREPITTPAVDALTHRLTRTLADISGLATVGEAVLQHVVQAVPSRMASLAVAAPDGELSIVATYGYPRALVEHLRIAPGTGVIGSVYQSRAPLVVPDVTATAAGLDRRRTRYRTNSFAVVPIIAGGEVLGVVSLTDRLAPGPYTPDDVAAIRTLLAPVALALGRERVWREAQAYAQAAVIDPVSGLFNRRYFQARLEEELHRAIRQSTSVALLMVDLDGFKSINDRFGHVAGDMVIRDISEILRRSVRIFDVCTRFGGEEFAVMMPGGTAESAGTIAERIRQRVETYQRSESELATLHVTASIGVAVSPPGVTARDLIERADRALYHAKRAGKNRVSTTGPDGTVLDS
ncbi:MAG TPA: sensor domain-containing diguanylate cyclase [Vicinamibacterales bacterium]|nr:sensor domain-containing diguanylate cyclase [Vicinamibacterales bacterium]